MGLIYLDSCLLIYAIERDPNFGQQIRDALTQETENEFAISPLVKLECLVKHVLHVLLEFLVEVGRLHGFDHGF